MHTGSDNHEKHRAMGHHMAPGAKSAMEHEAMGHEMGGKPRTEGGHDHQSMMIADFKRRFWVSLIFTIPVLLLATEVQELLGIRETLGFTGESYAAWALSSVIYFYGGYPFLKGFVDEVKSRAS